jgi:hypothetical protein
MTYVSWYACHGHACPSKRADMHHDFAGHSPTLAHDASDGSRRESRLDHRPQRTYGKLSAHAQRHAWTATATGARAVYRLLGRQGRSLPAATRSTPVPGKRELCGLTWANVDLDVDLGRRHDAHRQQLLAPGADPSFRSRQHGPTSGWTVKRRRTCARSTSTGCGIRARRCCYRRVSPSTSSANGSGTPKHNDKGLRARPAQTCNARGCGPLGAVLQGSERPNDLPLF